MNRTGVFGGTFNPIHTGHLILAEYVCDELSLDKLIFIPTKNPPHKNKREIIDENNRLKMVKISIEGNKRFTVSDIELKTAENKKSYTIDTLLQLSKKINNKNKFFLIIGFDSYLELDTWKEPERIFEIADVIVLSRPDYHDEKENKFRKQVQFLKSPLISISSTEIRKKIKNHKSIKYLVPEKVEKFIYKNKLYIKKHDKQ